MTWLPIDDPERPADDQDWIDEQMFGDEECGMCGGDGYYDGECACGDDTCCCLEPEPVPCPQCNTLPHPTQKGNT